MKKTKNIISLIVLMIICISSLCVYFFMPSTKADDKVSTSQIVYSGLDTGASQADKSKKGGALFVNNGSTYNMLGGTIQKTENAYGGAVFVADGATFNMLSGTIKDCNAMYGGAIYVAKGGTCNIEGGTIINCGAEYAPAIFVENGGTLNLSKNYLIENNNIQKYVNISSAKELLEVGSIGSGLNLRYIEFGSYPQTYVGSSMNSTLEEWYTQNTPTSVATYSQNFGKYYAYLYTDGFIYARGLSQPYATGYKYHNGDDVIEKGSAVWFKVEPIKWIILNYDNYKSGKDDYLEVISHLALSGGVKFSNSTTDTDGIIGTSDDPNQWQICRIRTWLNSTFYDSAFTPQEQSIIKQTLVGNNLIGDANNELSDTRGQQTVDKLYCPSYWELTDKNNLLISQKTRSTSPTDYAISTCCAVYDNAYNTSTGKICLYWTRSVGSTTANPYAAFVVNNVGKIAEMNLTSNARGVRPVMRLVI